MEYTNRIIAGDCLTVMRSIADNSVDVTFADPPFNLKKKYNGYIDSREFEEYLHWCQQWIEQMVRITKPTGSIFVHNIPRWLTYYASFLNSCCGLSTLDLVECTDITDGKKPSTRALWDSFLCQRYKTEQML